MKARILSVVLAFAIGGGLASAQGTFSWQFNQTNFVVGPGAIILLSGTVSNTTDSLQVIALTEAAFPLGELQDMYNFTWMGNNLDGAPVASHRELHFTFGSLSPVNLNAPSGTYISGLASLTLFPSQPQSSGPIQVSVVPEPTAMALLALGFGGVCLARRRA